MMNIKTWNILKWAVKFEQHINIYFSVYNSAPIGASTGRTDSTQHAVFAGSNINDLEYNIKVRRVTSFENCYRMCLGANNGRCVAFT